MNPYIVETLSRYQLEQMRADAAILGQVRAVRPPQPLRVMLGLALIRIGTWTLGPTHRRLAPRPS
jgi:hypothetical protein